MARTLPAAFPGRNPETLLSRHPVETSDAVDMIEGLNYAAAHNVPGHWSTEHSVLSAMGSTIWPIVCTDAAYANNDYLIVPITTGLVAGAGDVSILVFVEGVVAVQAFDVRVRVCDDALAVLFTATGSIAVGTPAETNCTVTVAGLDPDTDYVVVVDVKSAVAGGTFTLHRTACWDEDRAIGDLPG